MVDTPKDTKKSEPSETYNESHVKHGISFVDVQQTAPRPNKPQNSPESTPSPSQSKLEPPIHQNNQSNIKTSPGSTPEHSSAAEHPLVSFGQKDPPVSEFNFPAPPREASQEMPVPRVNDGLKPLTHTESAPRVQDSPLAKSPAPQSLLTESLTGQRAKVDDSSLAIPPLDGYTEPRRADSVDASVTRIKSADAQPQQQLPPAQISLGELAARLNQGEIQKPASHLSADSEAISTKLNENIAPAQKNSFIPSAEAPRVLTNGETPKPILSSSEQSQHHEIPVALPAAQVAPLGSERSLPVTSPPALIGQVSINRDNAHDASPASIANRPVSISPDRPGASDKTANVVDQKSRIDTSLTERSTKADSGKIETIDARSAAKPNSSASSSGGSDLVKSNRVETQSTDKSGKTEKADKADSTKSHDGTKTRAEMSNQNKREPLIIPGVITSRTSDGGKGSRGTKTDGSGKPDSKNPDTKSSDTTKVDTKKVDGGSAGIKTGSTASDAVSGRKDNVKVDKSDEKGDQRADTKIAASTSSVISGVAGRIVDGLATIKDKLIPGIRTNVDSRSGKADSHPEFANHSAQPKSNDAGLGIGRELKPLLPSGNSEFIYNGKRPLSDAREDTLSSKTGGLKQALLQIFGNHPDIASDLKANTFPGPKTVPFERTPDKPGEIQTTKPPNSDAAYLRNQKGDKITTGDLREQLAELRSNPDQLKQNQSVKPIASENVEADSMNRQHIKDFTVQLGEIAIGAASVPASEFFTTNDTVEPNEEMGAGDDEYDSRYLYYVKEGDTLRSIFDSQLAHESGNESVFEYFVKTNEQTVRLASLLSADSMSFILRPGTVLKLPTPRQIAQLKP